MLQSSSPTAQVRSSAFCWWVTRLLKRCQPVERQEALHAADAISRHLALSLVQGFPLDHVFDTDTLRWQTSTWLSADIMVGLLESFGQSMAPGLRSMVVRETSPAPAVWQVQHHPSTTQAWRWSQQHTSSLWRVPGLTERAASLVVPMGPHATHQRALQLHTCQPAALTSQGERLLLACELVATWPCWDTLQAEAWLARPNPNVGTWHHHAQLRRGLRSRAEAWVNPSHLLDTCNRSEATPKHGTAPHEGVVAWMASWHDDMPERGATLEAWWDWTADAATWLGCGWLPSPPRACLQGRVEDVNVWQRLLRTLLQQTSVLGSMRYGPLDAPCTHWVDARLPFDALPLKAPPEVWGVLDTHHPGWDPASLLGVLNLPGLPITSTWQGVLQRQAHAHASCSYTPGPLGYCLGAAQDDEGGRLTPRKVWQACFEGAAELVEAVVPSIEHVVPTTVGSQDPLRCPSERMQGTWSVSALGAFTQCPFAGIAQHVLGLRQQRQPHVGLDAAEWGECVHHLLEAFWTRCSDHASLIALRATPRYHATVMEVVEGVVRRWRGRKPLTWGDVARPLTTYPTIAVAQERLQQQLQRLLLAWLDVEAQRAPFEVEAVEVTTTWSHDQVTWQGRLDRVDRLATGERVVWDIKTGSVTLRHALPPEVAAPQLPGYALAYPDTPSAVGYALIQHPSMRFHVLGSVAPEACAASNQGGHRDPETWSALLDAWRDVLGQRTEAWLTGEASLAPIDGDATCERCAVRPVCRRDDLRTPRAPYPGPTVACPTNVQEVES